jgi:chlorite dismutase
MKPSMRQAEIAAKNLDGWFVLHQFFRASWPALKRHDANRRNEIAAEFTSLLQDWSALEEGWSRCYRIVGGGADYLIMHFRPSLDLLADVERRVRLTSLGDHLDLVYDYVSVVELGLYQLTADFARRNPPPEDPEGMAGWRVELEKQAGKAKETDFSRSRLYPTQPDDMPYVCFYPMTKRRGEQDNWYSLPLEERAALMSEHGLVGRAYAGRITQIISGSIGFDDWEWGVTLFARDPLDFKNVITDMRYDEASAKYAEFGRFFVGKRMRAEDWLELGRP